MKKAVDQTEESGKNEPRKKKVHKAFRNFAEYWHFVKNLPEYQRKLLVNSMSRSEQKSLKSSYDRGGWEDLFMRNSCDEILDEINKESGVDLLAVRFRVLSNKPQLMHKTLWTYINTCFDKIPWEHIAYVFDGIIVEEHDKDYMKLVSVDSK